MDNSKLEYFLIVFASIAIISSSYLIYRTEKLSSCVDAKHESGKLYSETKECRYLFNN
jgi:hypothetical protein